MKRLFIFVLVAIVLLTLQQASATVAPKAMELTAGVSYKNQTATNFYGVQFLAKSLFDAYSGERAYLLTGGDERGSC